jgi:hypothetical protein
MNTETFSPVQNIEIIEGMACSSGSINNCIRRTCTYDKNKKIFICKSI